MDANTALLCERTPPSNTSKCSRICIYILIADHTFHLHPRNAADLHTITYNYKEDLVILDFLQGVALQLDNALLCFRQIVLHGVQLLDQPLDFVCKVTFSFDFV